MAEIYEDDPDQRESWLSWLIVFLQRGLCPKGSFMVHGPHPEAAYMWGEAECDCVYGIGAEIEFKTSECSSISDIRGVRVRDKDSGKRYPVMKPSKLPEKWQGQITDAKKELARLRKNAD